MHRLPETRTGDTSFRKRVGEMSPAKMGINSDVDYCLILIL